MHRSTRLSDHEDYQVVSVAYRFMPQGGMDDQLADCTDALEWCMAHLPSLLGPSNIDIDRYAVAGDSAGGTLSTQCGHLFDPSPKAVIDVFGVVDTRDPWFHVVQKDGKNTNPAPYLRPRDEADLGKAMADRDPANAEVIQTLGLGAGREHTLQSFWGMPDYVPTDKEYFRMDLYKYISRQRAGLRILFRREAFGSDEEFMAKLRSLSPYYMLDVETTYPPTFFLHGTADTAVPIEQSYRMAKKLRGMAVPVGEAYCDGGEHCFEQKIEGSQDDGWDQYIVPCMDFVDKHVKA